MTEDDKEEGDGMGVLVMCCCITSQSQARLLKPTHMYFLLLFPGSGIWVVLVPFLSKMWSRCQPGLTGAMGSSAKVTSVIVDRRPQLSMLLHGVVSVFLTWQLVSSRASDARETTQGQSHGAF